MARSELNDLLHQTVDRLEAWLRRKRWTVALFVPLVGVAGFALRRWLGEGPWSAALGWPPLFVLVNLVMALPLALGLRGLWSRRALAAVAGLAGFSWLIEAIGVATGWPYGDFEYAIGLEPLLFGLVPLALPLFWLPMVLNAWMLAVAGEDWLEARRTGRDREGRSEDSRDGRSALPRVIGRWLAGTLLLVGLDLVLDPGAVALGFWAWEKAGAWYGVPWVNFGGWLISGAVGMGLAAWGLPADRLRRRLAGDDLAWGTLWAFLSFWAPINALHGQWWPVVLAGLLVLILSRFHARKAVRAAEVEPI